MAACLPAVLPEYLLTALKDRVHDAGDLFGPPASGPVRPEASAQPSSIALIYAPTLWLLAAMGTRVGGRGLKRSPPPSLTLSWNAVTGILTRSFSEFPCQFALLGSRSRGVNHSERGDVPGGPATYWNRIGLRQWVLEGSLGLICKGHLAWVDAGTVLANQPRPESPRTEDVFPEFLVHHVSLAERWQQELCRELLPVVPEVRQLRSVANLRE